MKKILGVTGCPTGIAHTFMAAEALKIAAKELNVEIKVETNGAIGVEDALTWDDIEQAECIIVACDKKVDMERFNGKPVIEVSVAQGIQRAKELVLEAVSGNVTVRGGTAVHHHIGSFDEKPSMGHVIYKHLMNGVSHMIPFVVAGGVLIAISFLWGIYSFDPNSEQYNPTAALLKQVGGYSMGLMVPILTAAATGSGFLGGIIGGFLAGYVALGLVKALAGLPKQFEGLKSIFIVPLISVAFVGVIMCFLSGPVAALNEYMMVFLSNLQNSSPILLGIVIGCMCAFDMGGPVNKAAYVTGTLLLGQGNYYFMAGVSAACIAPPILIAIATTVFKNRFTKDERAAGLVNYILGFTHITEGAIPFAAKSPLKVIPILMLGSSIAAVLTYLLKIQVPAPHGGFLILALVDQPVAWVLSIFIGAGIGAVLYGFSRDKLIDSEGDERHGTIS